MDYKPGDFSAAIRLASEMKKKKISFDKLKDDSSEEPELAPRKSSEMKKAKISFDKLKKKKKAVEEDIPDIGDPPEEQQEVGALGQELPGRYVPGEYKLPFTHPPKKTKPRILYRRVTPSSRLVKPEELDDD
jgi:hypothetical protein